MRTKDELFRAAQREVAAYRQQAVMQAETAHAAPPTPLTRRWPRRCAQMRAGLSALKAAALGGNTWIQPAPRLPAAEEALAAAVQAAGFSADDFKPAYRCPLCQDTRYARRCPLPLRGRRRPPSAPGRDQRRQPAGPVPVATPRSSATATPWSRARASPREYMGKLLNYRRGYAAKFSQNSPNLLFMGHLRPGQDPHPGAGDCRRRAGGRPRRAVHQRRRAGRAAGARALQLHDQRRVAGCLPGSRPADLDDRHRVHHAADHQRAV